MRIISATKQINGFRKLSAQWICTDSTLNKLFLEETFWVMIFIKGKAFGGSVHFRALSEV